MIKQYKIEQEFFDNNIELIDNIISASVNSDTHMGEQFFQDLIQEMLLLEPILLLNSLCLIQCIELNIKKPDWFLESIQEKNTHNNLFSINHINPKLINLTDKQKLAVQENCLLVICNETIVNKYMKFTDDELNFKEIL